uniref:RING-type domain-containing protein n=1 Tax=Salarias fasciatus TaxID=181472 RepID=A0A672GC77_SALFA
PEERKPEDEDLDPSCACLCCWDVLVDPVTLLCQHTFCLHCLALWFDVSERDVCPQCLEEWFIYPEIDVELRDTVNGLFYSSVQRRRSQIQRDARISRSLRRLERYFQLEMKFYLYVICYTLIGLCFYMQNLLSSIDILTTDPATKWNPNDVASWLDMMGPWAEQYKEAFKQGIDYGR